MGERRFLSGDEACAEGVRLARPHVISAYPITPQTVAVERLSEMVERGDLQAEYIHVESEHSALLAQVRDAAFRDEIADRERLHLGIIEHHAVHLGAAALGELVCKQLRDKALLRFEQLPRVGIKAPLGDVSEYPHAAVLVLRPEYTPLALYHVGRPPRNIKVMRRL